MILYCLYALNYTKLYYTTLDYTILTILNYTVLYYTMSYYILVHQRVIIPGKNNLAFRSSKPGATCLKKDELGLNKQMSSGKLTAAAGAFFSGTGTDTCS